MEQPSKLDSKLTGSSIPQVSEPTEVQKKLMVEMIKGNPFAEKYLKKENEKDSKITH